jgi:hypothetical protein
VSTHDGGVESIKKADHLFLIRLQAFPSITEETENKAESDYLTGMGLVNKASSLLNVLNEGKNVPLG